MPGGRAGDHLGSEYAPIRYYLGDIPARIYTFHSKSKRFPEIRSDCGDHIGPGCYFPDEKRKKEEEALPGFKPKKVPPSAWANSVTARFNEFGESKPIVEPKWRPSDDQRVWHRQGVALPWSKTQRFKRGTAERIRGQATEKEEAFHRTYDTDCLHFRSIHKSVDTSPIRFSNLRSSTERIKPVSPEQAKLGPGCYDPKAAADLSSGLMDKKGSASFLSNTNRFMLRILSNPASTYSFEQEKRKWTERGVAWSTQDRFVTKYDL